MTRVRVRPMNSRHHLRRMLKTPETDNTSIPPLHRTTPRSGRLFHAHAHAHAHAHEHRGANKQQMQTLRFRVCQDRRVRGRWRKKAEPEAAQSGRHSQIPSLKSLSSSESRVVRLWAVVGLNVEEGSLSGFHVAVIVERCGCSRRQRFGWESAKDPNKDAFQDFVFPSSSNVCGITALRFRRHSQQVEPHQNFATSSPSKTTVTVFAGALRWLGRPACHHPEQAEGGG